MLAADYSYHKATTVPAVWEAAKRRVVYFDRAFLHKMDDEVIFWCGQTVLKNDDTYLVVLGA